MFLWNHGPTRYFSTFLSCIITAPSSFIWVSYSSFSSIFTNLKIHHNSAQTIILILDFTTFLGISIHCNVLWKTKINPITSQITLVPVTDALIHMDEIGGWIFWYPMAIRSRRKVINKPPLILLICHYFELSYGWIDNLIDSQISLNLPWDVPSFSPNFWGSLKFDEIFITHRYL